MVTGDAVAVFAGHVERAWRVRDMWCVVGDVAEWWESEWWSETICAIHALDGVVAADVGSSRPICVCWIAIDIDRTVSVLASVHAGHVVCSASTMCVWVDLLDGECAADIEFGVLLIGCLSLDPTRLVGNVSGA